MLVLAAAAAMMVLMLAMSAGSALGDNSFDRGNDFGDQELQSGSIGYDTNIGIEGNYDDQDVGLSQSADTGNYANQQGFGGGDDGCWAWNPYWGWYDSCD